jgi:rhodanese-related sulfurtransferase
MDFHKIISFLLEHWQLSGLFLILLVLLLIAEAKAQGKSKQLNPQGLVSLINKDSAYLVDIRENTAFTRGHIKGAHNISKADLPSHTSKLPKDEATSIVLICQRGQTASSVFSQLSKKGFANLHILKGGMDAWSQEGMPISTAKSQSKKGKKND